MPRPAAKARQIDALRNWKPTDTQILDWVGQNVERIDTLHDGSIEIDWYSEKFDATYSTRRSGSSDIIAFRKAVVAAMREWKEQQL